MPGRIGVWDVVGGLIGYPLRVKQHQVGLVARAHEPTIGQAKPPGR